MTHLWVIHGIRNAELEHVDENGDEIGGVHGVPGTVRKPLVENQEDQVAKDGQQEEDLWDELQEQTGIAA